MRNHYHYYDDARPEHLQLKAQFYFSLPLDTIYWFCSIYLCVFKFYLKYFFFLQLKYSRVFIFQEPAESSFFFFFRLFVHYCDVSYCYIWLRWKRRRRRRRKKTNIYATDWTMSLFFALHPFHQAIAPWSKGKYWVHNNVPRARTNNKKRWNLKDENSFKKNEEENARSRGRGRWWTTSTTTT